MRQYLGEGLIDELQLHVVPALLGAGLRLFEGVGAGGGASSGSGWSTHLSPPT
ncbi:dihydrofolate reductase family protein [Streptomyces sp. NPDC001118]